MEEREKRGKGKMENREGKEGEIVKGEEENLKWKVERYENEQRTFLLVTF